MAAQIPATHHSIQNCAWNAVSVKGATTASWTLDQGLVEQRSESLSYAVSHAALTKIRSVDVGFLDIDDAQAAITKANLATGETGDLTFTVKGTNGAVDRLGTLAGATCGTATGTTTMGAFATNTVTFVGGSVDDTDPFTLVAAGA